MANFKQTVITKAAHNLIAKSLSGSANINFTRVATSKYDYKSFSQSKLESLTSLEDIKQYVAVDKVEKIGEASVNVSVKITNANITEGYYVNTIGLFAMDPEEGEILYSVTVAETADYFPADNGVNCSGINLDLVTEVSNASNVNITVNYAGYATNEDIEKVNSQLNDITQFTNLRKPKGKIFGMSTYLTPDYFVDVETVKKYIDQIKEYGFTDIEFCFIYKPELTDEQIASYQKDCIILVEYLMSKNFTNVLMKFHNDSYKNDAPYVPTAQVDFNRWSSFILYFISKFTKYTNINLVAIACEAYPYFIEEITGWSDLITDIKSYLNVPVGINPTVEQLRRYQLSSLDIFDWCGFTYYDVIRYFDGDITKVCDKDLVESFKNTTDSISLIKSLKKALNKPVFITEIGCTPTVGACGGISSSSIKDEEEQLQWYKTVFPTLMDTEIDGLYLWSTYSDYTPFENKAGQWLKKYLS